MTERVEATVIGGTNHGTVTMVDRDEPEVLFTKGGTLASFVAPLSQGEPLPKEAYVLRRSDHYESGYVLLPSDDGSLLAAYQRTDGQPGNPEADALVEEIRRRNLGI